jgi:hypothetical protein
VCTERPLPVRHCPRAESAPDREGVVIVITLGAQCCCWSRRGVPGGIPTTLPLHQPPFLFASYGHFERAMHAVWYPFNTGQSPLS